MSSQRVAIVTGSGRGIGACIARQLAQSGHSVAVLDLDASACDGTVEAIREAGGTAQAVSVDVGDQGSVADAVSSVAAQLGAPSVLVNNAGITRDNLLFKMSVDDWDDVVRVHLRGMFLMTRAVQAHMTSARWGRIVNLSSASALGSRGQSNYAAAKAGVMGFTKTVAIELGQFGVTVNCVAPGFIVTEMTAKTADRLGLAFEDYQSQMAALVAVRRVGQPEDVANAVSYLVSDGAGFVTGNTLFVAGGPLG